MKREIPNELLSDSEVMKQWLIQKSEVSIGFSVISSMIVRKAENMEPNAMLLFRLLPTAVMTTQKNEKTAEAEAVGGTNIDKLSDTVCNLGILRIRKEEKPQAELTPFSDIAVGAVAYPSPTMNRKGDVLYGQQLSSLAQLELAAETIRRIQANNLPVTVVVLNETLCGIEPALALMETYSPTALTVCTPADCQKNFQSGNGGGIGIKDGNWVADRAVSESISSADTESQPFVGNTGDVLARCYLALGSKELRSLYLPVTMLGNCLEEVKQTDFTATQGLLIKSIEI